MGDISKSYSMHEFNVSASFPHLAKGVPAQYRDEIKALVDNVLQPINDATGWFNYISSGYRSKELNEAVGGAGSTSKGGNISQHTVGEASDNNFYQVIQERKFPVSSHDVAKQVKKLGLDFDQMILYPTFVHLSYTKRHANRKYIGYSKNYKGRRL